MAAAGSEYLANINVDAFQLDTIDFDPLPALNRPVNDDGLQGVPGNAPLPQQPPAPSFLQAPQGLGDRIDVGMGPGGVTGFGPGAYNYGLHYFNNPINPGIYQSNPNTQPRPYQPNNIYPDFGLAGRNGPSYTPMNAWFKTTNHEGQEQITPTQVHLSVDDMQKAYHNAPTQPIRGYWGREDGGRYGTQQPFPGGFAPFLNQPMNQQPAQGQEAGYINKHEGRDFYDLQGRGDGGAPVPWVGPKIQNNRALKQKGDSACDPSKIYKDALPLVTNWKKKSGGGPHFEYTALGQWVDHLEFSAAEVHHYLQHCPRDVNIFVQQPPAQANSRQQECDRRCRYAQCPVDSKIIRPGFLRVVFDEYHNLTSNGRKDPFKVAGCMHLWCFEQCVDPYDYWSKKKLFPDDRHLPKEQKNLMAINRDTDRAIVNRAFMPWMSIQEKLKQQGDPEIPRDHQDSLTYALVKYHLDNQVTARQTCRDRRNKAKAEEDRNTLDVHLGDLRVYARRCRAIKARKRTGPKRRKPESPYPKGLEWVPPKDLPLEPELVLEDMFKKSVHSPLQSPIKTPIPVAPIFEQYVQPGKEGLSLMQLDRYSMQQGDRDLVQLDPNLMQPTEQTDESTIVAPEPDMYDFTEMVSSGDLRFKGLPPLEESNSMLQTQAEESTPTEIPPPQVPTPLQLDSITPALPDVDQPEPGPKPQSPEVNTGSRKRRASDLEDDEDSLFGSSPRSKRQSGSVSSKSSERQSQGAPLRRSPRQDPKQSAT
ncbi:hypothetical protein LCI18_001227 [Fusarium solani-melongenae]|uniref:Uncharacterized protein n=1 Tax=Fusarium solani subsp. cucurbitae TaxID=2747967 RepID=A0ACD3YMV8_FUSSC|nr:hypothetical protein LCI18_001227 [Fusarium solani-melongenae]